MILLIANRWDEAARTLAQRWSPHPAALLTADDLSRPGWSVRASAPETNTLVVSGQPIPQREITAVLTLTPGLIEQELFTITPSDRTYVAAEINAFLLAWLSSLPCRVLNRPTPSSLAGPSWHPERWTHTAAQSFIPTRPHRRTTALHHPPADPENAIPETALILTVIGDQVLPPPGQPEPHPTLSRHALTLAHRAQVDLLAVRFSSPDPDAQFLDADPFPDLTPNPHAEAVLNLLQHPTGAAA